MRKTPLSHCSLALLAGAFFWSSWLQTARLALTTRLPFVDGGAAPQKRQPSARERLELSQLLGRAVKDPRHIDEADLRAVKKAWGAESERLLRLLRQSSN